MDALKRSNHCARGVATVTSQVTDQDLEQLNDAGVRGVRFNFVKRLVDALPHDELMSVSTRIKSLGWHVVIYFEGHELDEHRPFFESLPVPLVFDHMGHVPASKGIGNSGFQQLLALVSSGKAYVKLSATYRLSAEQAPYKDTHPFACELLKANIERCLWATDWPHPGLSVEAPSDEEMMETAVHWMATSQAQKQILVDDPEQLYDFSASNCE